MTRKLLTTWLAHCGSLCDPQDCPSLFCLISDIKYMCVKTIFIEGPHRLRSSVVPTVAGVEESQMHYLSSLLFDSVNLTNTFKDIHDII